MVANELPFERYVPTVLDILSKADKVIAYNAAFEDSYLTVSYTHLNVEKSQLRIPWQRMIIRRIMTE